MMKTIDKKDLILKNPNLFKSIVILALPIFFSNLLKSIHSFVDMYFVSPIGDQAITAITITNPIISISYALGTGFMIAGVAIMSQALGAGNKEKANRTCGQLFLMSSIVAIIFNVLLFASTPLIVKAIGATGETYSLAVTYVRIRSFELLPIFTFFTFLASRQASGDTITPVIFDIIAIIGNVILTWLFVDVLDLGLRGAAIGTIIGNIMIMPAYLFMLFKDKKADISISIKDIKFNQREANQILRLGLPSAASQAFTSLGFLIVNALVLSYGEPTVAGFGVGNIINSFILMPAMGVGGSVTTFVGQNIGANNPKRAQASVRSALIITLIIMIVGASILLPLRKVLGNIFLDPGKESYDIAIEYMVFLFTSLPLMAIYQVFIGSYQGAGYTKYSLILATVRLWGLRIPLIYLFRDAFKLDSTSVMYAMVISNFGACLLGLLLYRLIRFDRKIDFQMED